MVDRPYMAEAGVPCGSPTGLFLHKLHVLQSLVQILHQQAGVHFHSAVRLRWLIYQVRSSCRLTAFTRSPIRHQSYCQSHLSHS